jgi:riboflavin kinase
MTSNVSHDSDGAKAVSSGAAGETELTLTGDVTAGMGKAKEFLSLPGYVAQFKERLGYEPYPGTLNVTLTGDLDSRLRVATFESVSIDSWELDGQTFGGAECYPCDIETRTNESYDDAYVLVPDRTDHEDDKLELIAPARLRDSLELADGDELTVTLGKRV